MLDDDEEGGGPPPYFPPDHLKQDGSQQQPPAPASAPPSSAPPAASSPGFLDLPDLPAVPVDTPLGSKGGSPDDNKDDDIDFDDLTKRFEALKKKKWSLAGIVPLHEFEKMQGLLGNEFVSFSRERNPSSSNTLYDTGIQAV